MDKKRVALLFGGRGAEREISKKSAEFVLPRIDRGIFEPISVFISRDGAFWLIKDGERTPCALTRGGIIDAGNVFLPIFSAFALLHGDFGEDGRVQGLLECLDIPYVGCGVTAGAVCSDKALTKTVAEHIGIPSVPWMLHTRGENPKKRAELNLKYPMFFKPCALGSSIGIERARSPEEFDRAQTLAEKYGERIIIEEGADILCELECAFFESLGKSYFNVGSVFADGFFDYEKKYGSEADTRCGAVKEEYSEAVISYSRALVREIGIRQIARLDFFLTKTGEILFNEINTMPGFTERSLYPALIHEAGIEQTELITRLLLEAPD